MEHRAEAAPETRAGSRGEVEIRADVCKGCALCVAACPVGVLRMTGTLNRQGYFAVGYAGAGCTGCGICFYVCPEPAAITVRVLRAPSRAHRGGKGCAR